MRASVVTVFAGAMLLFASLAAAQGKTGHDAVYERFNQFCIKHFGAEKEPLVYQKFGNELKMLPDGSWKHVSERSACVGFETNLPAKSYVECGETPAYGKRTPEPERYFYLHLHYLKDLDLGKTYHYRMVSVDERGNKIATEDATFKTEAIAGTIHVPGDFEAPPYVLDKPKTTYVLTSDVATDVTAFKVTAEGVTLDLGGHTVIYNTKKMGKKWDGWPEYLKNGSQGVLVSKVDGVKILNGAIRQGAGDDDAGSYSLGFSPIHTRGSNDLELAGLTVQYGSKQKVGIYNQWGGKNSEFHHNVFVDVGSEVLNRHGIGCTALLCGSKDGSDNIKTHHNLVKRTRQFGLSGKEVYNNEIYIDSRSTNSFGIRRYTTRTARNNRILGTGFFPMAAAWGTGQTFRDNFIHLEGQDPVLATSYGEQEKRCNLLGFRITQYGGSKVAIENSVYRDNVVVIRVRDGSAGCGTWFCSDANVKGIVFRDNTVKVMAMDRKPFTSKYKEVACVATQGDHRFTDQHLPIVYRDNTFVSNINHVAFGSRYATGSNHHFYNCRFVKVGNDPRYKTFRWSNAHPCKNHIVRDAVFEGGAGLESIHFGDGDHDLTVQWTLTVKTAPGAKVTIKDKTGEEVFSGTADDKGLVSAPLSQYRHAAKGKTFFTPHTVTVGKDGRQTTKKVTVAAKEQVAIPLR